ncbi:MAG TPA: LuxR C-terminal-related transcriptional regulator [bacterium]|nr:LuxR C-terminal-related transcriptional regulator [bacterium]
MKSEGGVHQNVILDAVCAAAESASLKDLTAVALPKLAEAFDATLASIVEVVPGEELQLQEYVAPGMPNPYPQYWRGAYYESDPFEELRRHRRKPQVAIMSQLVDPKKYKSSGFYNEITKPLEIERVLEAHLVIGDCATPGTVSIVLSRSRRQLDWNRDHVAALSQILPSFAAVVRRQMESSRSSELFDEILAHSESKPCLALDRLGRLLWTSAAAEAFWREHFPAEKGPPFPLLQAARRLCGSADRREALALKPEKLWLGEAPGFGPEAELRLLRWRGGGEPYVLVQLSSRNRGTGLAQTGLADSEKLRSLYSLTQREIEVLGGLVQGQSNAQIAKSLFISPETIRTHLQHIFEKLGVQNRVQAVVKINRH